MSSNKSDSADEDINRKENIEEASSDEVKTSASKSSLPVKKDSMEADHPHRSATGWRYVSLVFFCFIASFLGAWVFVSSGLVDTGDGVFNSDQQTIVSQEGDIVAGVAKDVAPSVVSIVTQSIDRTSFFQGETQSSAGTGVVISKDGYILTNKHVIGDATSTVSIIMNDGTLHERVRVVGRDPLNDLAFLKIEGVSDLKPVELGDSAQLEVGDKVIAIGNALGVYDTTVTTGIVSGVARPLAATNQTDNTVERLENLLQTDAAINPGNSGGPLLTLDGKVIGINTAIAAGAEGIGFAIPINDAKGLIRSVLDSGKVERAYLGVRYVTITPAIKDEYNLERKEGAYIPRGDNSVMSGSPAARAGLQPGDVLIKVNDKDLTQRQPLSSVISAYSAGETVTLTYMRSGKTETTQVTLDSYPR